MSKYATRLLKLRVDEIELKLRVNDKKLGGFVPVRLIASSSTGGWLTREAYREYLDPISGQALQYCSLDGKQVSYGSQHILSYSPTLYLTLSYSLASLCLLSRVQDLCVTDPYPTSSKLQLKRNAARRTGSTYANDFLGLLEVALINSWQRFLEQTSSASAPPPSMFSFEELVLSRDGKTLNREKRFPGDNKIGMLAWICSMKTPQYPAGRDVVVIANDVTVQSGSFGVQEDEFFFKASEFARLKVDHPPCRLAVLPHEHVLHPFNPSPPPPPPWLYRAFHASSCRATPEPASGWWRS